MATKQKIMIVDEESSGGRFFPPADSIRRI